MWLSIVENRTGEEWLKPLPPKSDLDLRRLVREWADIESDGLMRPSFSEPGSHIPNGCADYQAEIRRTKRGGASCWTCEPFYMESCDE